MKHKKDIIHKDDVAPKSDACGLIRQLYSSRHLTIAHVEVVGVAKKHSHLIMEEIYYVTKGSGELVLGDKVLKIKEGDTIPIPKNTAHQLRTVDGKPFDIIFVTYPRFDLSDVYFEE